MSELKRFHSYLTQCKSVLILVGPGLGENVDLKKGWNNYHSIDLATPDAFIENPGLVWQYYTWRRANALKMKPNKAHYAIAEFVSRLISDEKVKRRCLVIDQNVDELSKRAGVKKLLNLHGSLFKLRCMDFFCHYEGYSVENPLTRALGWIVKIEEANERCIKEDGEEKNEEDLEKKRRKIEIVPKKLNKEDLPVCPKCGGILRPGVVWFGESIPLKTINAIDDFFLAGKVDLTIIAGTSGNTWPAMGYVERAKLQGGKIAIFDNGLDFTEIEKDEDCFGFEGAIEDVLPKALEIVTGTKYMPRGVR